MALGKIGNPGAATALVPMLQDGDPRVRQWAAWALGQMGEGASPTAGQTLVRLLSDAAPPVRTAAAQALGELDATAEVTASIVARLKSGEDEARLAATLALIGRLNEDRVPIMAEVLRDPLPSVRQAIVAALGEAGGNVALGFLQERLRNDPDAAVRTEAAYRLGIIGGPEVIAALREASRSDPDQNVRRWAVQAADAITSAGGRD